MTSGLHVFLNSSRRDCAGPSSFDMSPGLNRQLRPSYDSSMSRWWRQTRTNDRPSVGRQPISGIFDYAVASMENRTYDSGERDLQTRSREVRTVTSTASTRMKALHGSGPTGS